MPRLTTTTLALAAGLSAGAAAQELALGAAGAFERFAQDFKKVYDEAERELRFAAFAANYRHIEAENAKGHGYTLGLTPFADLTREEFAQGHLGYRADARRSWGSLAHLGTHVYSGGALPASVDWREKGAVTDVKNQVQCAACWAFAAVGALEGAWAIASGSLVSLSEQQLIDCSKKQGNKGCSGGLMDKGFEYEEGVPVCTEASYDFTAKDGVCKAASCTAGIPKGGVIGFRDVTADSDEALMEAVAQQPVTVAIEADQLSFQLYKGGVLDAPCGSKLDHGVLVVGYGEEDGKKYWLVRNSWGPAWGEGGYIRLLRGGAEPAEECGILSYPSYPVVQSVAPVLGVAQELVV